jgi:hypothetical protein
MCHRRLAGFSAAAFACWRAHSLTALPTDNLGVSDAFHVPVYSSVFDEPRWKH